MVQIILDSNTISNFISQQFVETYNIFLKKKARLIPLLVIDSTPISTKVITHQIVAYDLILELTNKYCKMLTLNIIPIVTYDVTLGILQLNIHTLQIYQSKRKLVFTLGYSLSALATIIITVDGIQIATMKEEELVKKLLEVYKNYKHLFTEEEANELPLHQLQNFSIKLIEGKTLPY